MHHLCVAVHIGVQVNNTSQGFAIAKADSVPGSANVSVVAALTGLWEDILR